MLESTRTATDVQDLERHFRAVASRLPKGPLGLIVAEDDVEIESTVDHHLSLGFAHIVLLAPRRVTYDGEARAKVTTIGYQTRAPDTYRDAVNALIRAVAPGTWIYSCYNAEYLFFPFSGSRSVGELLAFHAEERRSAMLTFVVDLYASDLARAPNAVSLHDAMLDRVGYYALGRKGTPERQLDFFGGLKWRHEEHVPEARRRIDRIGLYRTKPGLTLGQDELFSDPEYNTYACPWHNSLTACICSFRTAKALRSNPGSAYKIDRFTWHNSVPFEWSDRQLMDLGLMEPGQWF